MSRRAVRFAAIVQLLRLAVADIGRDGLLSSCSVLMLTASLAPLLTLFGLENGVIGTMIARQDKDPAMRLIVPEVSGGHQFDAAWFAQAAGWPEVSFVVPSTRIIAGLIDLVARAGGGAASAGAAAGSPGGGANVSSEPVRVSLLPSGPGDPVTVDLAGSSQADHIALSASAARKLGVVAGASVDAVIERLRDGRTEPVSTSLIVDAVLPVERYSGDAAFAALSLVVAIQDYRDGHAVPQLGWTGDGVAPVASAYPLFRLYARSIRDVARLVERLRQQGISVFARESEIASTLGLQRNLVAVLLIISTLAAVGFAVAMIALQIATVRRKRREYAILQLIGYGRSWLTALPCSEAIMLAGVGIALAFAMYAAAARVIDLYFADHLVQGESACHLSGQQALCLGALALAVSLLPAIVAGVMVSTLDPGDELRDV